ncbi:DUF4383 domain-containing protein [Paractinoplanes pyxinae]|uniref:DUF4383 domain-containing protein n=1 Tax=Paractinoplanes pyxinae TaxID=2997416 RepID=UPI003F68D11F
MGDAGAIDLVLWLYGLVIDHGSAANFVPVNTADNWLHFVLGIGMIGLGLATATTRTARSGPMTGGGVVVQRRTTTPPPPPQPFHHADHAATAPPDPWQSPTTRIGYKDPEWGTSIRCVTPHVPFC